MPQFRFTGPHAETLADGRPVAPGDLVEIKNLDAQDELLVTAGVLVETKKPGRRASTTPEKEGK